MERSDKYENGIKILILSKEQDSDGNKRDRKIKEKEGYRMGIRNKVFG